jgi:hypothetical protein
MQKMEKIVKIKKKLKNTKKRDHNLHFQFLDHEMKVTDEGAV